MGRIVQKKAAAFDKGNRTAGPSPRAASKRKDSRYRSGRSPDWLKMNPACAAVKRVDGKPRSYRELRAIAIESAEFLKRLNPHSEVAV